MLRAILFDVGDTLLDFAPMKTSTVVEQGARASYERLKQGGTKLPSFNKYRRGNVSAVRRALIWSRIIGREFSSLTIMRQRTARLGVPDTDEMMLELAWLWYQAVVDYSTVEPDVIPTLKLFREAGIKLGLVSNTCVGGPVLDRHLKLMGLIEYFPVRIYSCEVGYRKPHRRIFEEALAQIGEKPQDVLFVGDLVKKRCHRRRADGNANSFAPAEISRTKTSDCRPRHPADFRTDADRSSQCLYQLPP